MSRRGKVVGIDMRRPDPSATVAAEDAIRALEEKAEALGNGIAGRVEEAPAPEPAPPPAKPSPVVAVDASEHDQRQDTRIVHRKGRLLADGSRTEARTLRRMTVYLPPDLAMAIDRRALETGKTKSELAHEAFGQLLG